MIDTNGMHLSIYLTHMPADYVRSIFIYFSITKYIYVVVAI